MRYVLTLLAMLFVVGCGGAEQEFLLSVPSSSISTARAHVAQIGVDQVAVPDYLHSNKIPQEEAPGQLSYCDSAVWASTPEKALTNHLIRYLQKRFATPNVHRFPWDIEKSTGVRLKVVVNRFIYAGNVVELEASYYVEPIQGTRRRARLFTTRVPVAKGETPLIVAAMNRAFDRLAEDAARMIARF